MSNEAAERLLDHLMDQVGPSWQRKPALESVRRALAAERRATVERIAAQVDEYIAAFPRRNRTSLYGSALALRERLAQMAEQDAILDAEAAPDPLDIP